jgi:nitroreductase
MSAPYTKDECIRFLDEIIESRRSIRSFTNDIPSKDAIKAIIRAGLFASYAGTAVDQGNFRCFIVLRKGSQAMQVLER